MRYLRNRKWLGYSLEAIALLVSVIGVLVCMTLIDWIVHSVLYHYGLQFSYDWAVPYWTVLNASFFMFGLLAASAYLVLRDPELRHLSTALLIFWTVFIQMFAYNLDILWNVIDTYTGNRAFPSMDDTWGWGWVDWITRTFLNHPATARECILGSLALNLTTYLLWVAKLIMEVKE